jgi:holliday junction DNA helicase RuvA
VIGRISGVLLEKNPPQIMVDVGGVGYLLEVPMSTFYDLPALGERTALLTHFVVREDAQLLFGFLSQTERDAFTQLIKISGVGPRTALSILSGLSVTELSQAVTLQDPGRLTKVPGIGKKTAERLMLELKGKFNAIVSNTGAVSSIDDSQIDILNALLALGYNDKEANLAVKQLSPGLTVSAGIKQALQSLSGAR